MHIRNTMTVINSILFQRWKRSLYKMIWRHSLIFLVVYFSLTGLYNFGLGKKNRE